MQTVEFPDAVAVVQREVSLGAPVEAVLVVIVKGRAREVSDAGKVLQEPLRNIRALGRLRHDEPTAKPCGGCPDRVYQGALDPKMFQLAGVMGVEVMSVGEESEFVEWESRMGIAAPRSRPLTSDQIA